MSTSMNAEKFQCILTQIEHYFSDMNLIRDWFMRKEISRNNGWLKIETLIKFKRLASMTSDRNTIIESIKNSSFLVLDEKNENIGRKTENPFYVNKKKFEKEALLRSVYVKGFPENTTTNEIVDFMRSFNQSIYLKRRVFYDATLDLYVNKNSAFVEFPSAEDAKNFLSLRSFRYGENELIKISGTQYKKMKKEQKNAEIRNKEDAMIEERLQALNIVLRPFPKGSLLRVTWTTDYIDQEEVKDYLRIHYNAAFVSFNIRNRSAIVRLFGPCSADKLLRRSGCALSTRSVDLHATLIEGMEEDDLLDQMLREYKKNIVKKYNKTYRLKMLKRQRYKRFAQINKSHQPSTKNNAKKERFGYFEISKYTEFGSAPAAGADTMNSTNSLTSVGDAMIVDEAHVDVTIVARENAKTTGNVDGADCLVSFETKEKKLEEKVKFNELDKVVVGPFCESAAAAPDTSGNSDAFINALGWNIVQIADVVDNVDATDNKLEMDVVENADGWELVTAPDTNDFTDEGLEKYPDRPPIN